MKPASIHNLDTLEKEILRLRLKAKTLEQEIGKNMDYLQDNYADMLLHSFTKTKKGQAYEKYTVLDSLLKNERLNATLNTLTQHIADKASEHIENLVDKLFKKNE